MVLKTVETNANEILVATQNITRDISYLQSLEDTVTKANSRGVDVGTVKDTLKGQMSDLNGKLTQIGADLDQKLKTLTDLDKRISKSDAALVIDDSMEPVEVFRLVYARLQGDKATLQGILDQIKGWNTEHDLVVDDASVVDLMSDIDSTLEKFNKQITQIAEQARGYANLVKDVAEPMGVTADGASGASGGWKLVFRQTAGTWMAPDKWKSVNPDDPLADNFSLLDKLEDYKSGDKFDFKVSWPELATDKELVWRQSSNPLKLKDRVEGFEHVSGNAHSTWGGIALSNTTSTLLDGTPSKGGWWFAMGSRHAHGGGIPGSEPTIVKKVELFMKV